MTALVQDFADYAIVNLAKALSAILQRDSYLYWPYLLSALLIGLCAWRWAGTRGERRPLQEFWNEYFSERIWWHRSARADYLLYAVNALLLPAFLGWLLIGERELAAILRQTAGFADNSSAASVGLWPRLLFTLLFFVAYDFGRFVMHCLLHDVPLLWEFHKVHHSAEVLTPMTSFRAHPVELLLMAWGPVVTTGVLAFAFSALLPGSVTFYSFLGVHVLLFVSNLVGNLRHSPVWVSYGLAWGRWFISPAHHQLHHSCESRHIGCNRGFDLAIWDRLYGTLYVPGPEPETFRLGLGDQTDAQYHHLGRMYLLPFGQAARQIGVVIRRSVRRLSTR